MRNMFKVFLSIVALSSSLSFADQGFVPENTLYIPSFLKSESGVTQVQFYSVISRIETIYSKTIGPSFRIEKLWSDGTVNAYAYVRFGKKVVVIYGGLARHPAITPDGLAFAVCHEIGHHAGGAPLYPGSKLSVEGQADYFATTKCLRRVFENDDNEKQLKGESVPETVVKLCADRFKDKKDQFLCQRSSLAAFSVGKLFEDLEYARPIGFDTPDPKIVNTTQTSHPAAQCRLDTGFRGALCRLAKEKDFSLTNEYQGACHEFLNKKGSRPRCWFRPTLFNNI